jgi:cystathionine gamma-synthase
MISFEVPEERVDELISSLRLIKFAESLGGNVSLITHPYTQTHASLSGPEKKACGITKGLLRLSCGTESAVDIINDLRRSEDR